MKMMSRMMLLVACCLAFTGCVGLNANQKMTLAEAEITKQGWRPLSFITHDGGTVYWAACSEQNGPTKGQVGIIVVSIYAGETKIQYSSILKTTRCDQTPIPEQTLVQ